MFLEAFNHWVPCNKCIACRRQRAREWSTRLIHELSYWKHSCFLTLTYDDEHLPSDLAISKDELQRYFKRLRKDILPQKIKYFACGEYGDISNRPHYHAIILGLSEFDSIFDENWKKGFVKNASVSPYSIRYVTNYVLKKTFGKVAEEQFQGRQPPFQLVSQGMGKRWWMDNLNNAVLNGGITQFGQPVPIPRYYRKFLEGTGLDSHLTGLIDEKTVRAADAKYDLLAAKGLSDEVLEEYEAAANRQRKRTKEHLLELKSLSRKPGL